MSPRWAASASASEVSQAVIKFASSTEVSSLKAVPPSDKLPSTGAPADASIPLTNPLKIPVLDAGLKNVFNRVSSRFTRTSSIVLDRTKLLKSPARNCARRKLLGTVLLKLKIAF